MTRKLIHDIKNRRLFTEGCSVIAGVSGGADSIALLTFLCENRDELQISEIICAHFNHGLRESARRDELFVGEYCEKLGISCMFGYADVAMEAEANKEGIEAAARRLRYAFFRQAAARGGCDRIATGHTADDNAETVMINILRGTGLRGLGGIPEKRGIIVRPLLSAIRAEIEEYLASRNIEFVTDETNFDLNYRRNHIRHELMPKLKQLSPRLMHNFTRMTEKLREDEDFIGGQAGRVMAHVRHVPEGYAIEAGLLCSLHPALSSRVVRMMYELAGGNPQSLTQKHIDSMEALAGEVIQSGASISLPEGITAHRVYTSWVIGGKIRTEAIEPMRLEPGTALTLEGQGLFIKCRTANHNDKIDKINNSFNSFMIASDTINGDLIVRSRMQGDKICLPGRKTKTLKKLFIEYKIPQFERPNVPVLCDDDGVVAVMGFGVDKRHTPSETAEAWVINIGGLEV